MEALILEILDALRKKTDDLASDATSLTDKQLIQIIHRHNRNLSSGKRQYAKKKLLPYYLTVKEREPKRWATWNVSAELEERLVRLLQVKPRRTASGVATITVITKPWPCANDCLYCPNDIRMPKSYLSGEPACQRAERNHFDPYLQVVSRLRALTHMGHPTDKIELIVLGGTWSDYPQGYQIWFVKELFRALNDFELAEDNTRTRRQIYRDSEWFYPAAHEAETGRRAASKEQKQKAQALVRCQVKVTAGELNYNQALKQLYQENKGWQKIASTQVSTLAELYEQHEVNERAQHRAVGLVVETRPDTITVGNLELLRRLGCTKVQIGIQSLDQQVLALNNRQGETKKVERAFALLRLFGFKIHAHFMVNLYGSTPEQDKNDYQRFISEKAYQPDEVKLYPCSLVAGTGLCKHYANKTWHPYSEEELLEILIADTVVTPAFTRISRMIRDISAQDILAGNKKTNLRQMVEGALATAGALVAEIRYREINASEINAGQLTMQVLQYQTTVSNEFFLQWVTAENKIAGFLRLSLPEEESLLHCWDTNAGLPVRPGEAMIREVHVYGKAARLLGDEPGDKPGIKPGDEPGDEQSNAKDALQGRNDDSIQHSGLGRQLIEEACRLARTRGYQRINVISAVGTRAYYRDLGFVDNDLYQQKEL